MNSLLRFLFFFLFAFTVFTLNAKTIKVCKNCAVRSVHQAVALARDNDIIEVQKGIYYEPEIEIKKPLTITGIGSPVIDAKLKGGIFKILSNDVVIQGFKFINVPVSYVKEYSAITIMRAKNFKILNNNFDKIFFAILVEKSSYGIIKGNNISSIAKDEAGSGNGVHLWHCNHILVDKNVVTGMRDGIYLEFVSHSRIIRNNSYGNLRYGLHFMFSNNDEYHLNTFRNNGAGVAVMFSKFVKMSFNRFEHNWGPSSYGMLLKEIYDCEIYKNNFLENSTGIYLEGSTRINYLKNNFINNGWAIKVVGSSYSNIFKSNNFINNSFDLSYNSNINENLFEGNYWSSYTGYDLDKNGTGDIPYRPVKLFSYIVNKTPETIVLLRSIFIDIINFSEKVSPVFTPDNLADEKPKMSPLK
jgi:nitrous oxidase accessory protein